MATNLLIGTPASSGMLTISYVRSLLDLQQSILSGGGTLSAMYADMFLPRARDVLLTLFHEQKRFTHLLFIDSDMGYSPSLIQRMIKLDQPIVGVIAPQRHIDFAKIATVSKTADGLDDLAYRSANYATTQFFKNEAGKPITQNGFVEVAQLGTGIMLISREAITRIASIPGIQVNAPNLPTESKTVLQCFMPLVDAGGLMQSEDISFCQRWRESGGKLWANVDEEITHAGLQNVRGKYAAAMPQYFV